MPIYCKATDELELKKYLASLDAGLGLKPPIKMIESDSYLDIDSKGGVWVNDLVQKRLIFYKHFGEMDAGDFQFLRLLHNDMDRGGYSLLRKGKIKHRGDIFFDGIMEIAPGKLVLRQKSGTMHTLDLKKKKITVTSNPLNPKRVYEVFNTLYGQKYVDSLSRDSAAQELIKLVPYSLKEIRRINGKLYGLFRFLHIKNFGMQTLGYGLALLTFDDNLTEITHAALLDDNTHKFFPYSLSLTENNELLAVHYDTERYTDSMFYKITLADPPIYAPFFPVNIKLDSFQLANRGMYLGNSRYFNGYVTYSMFPVIATRYTEYDYGEIIKYINVPKKNVEHPIEVNGIVIDDNSFNQFKLVEEKKELHTYFRYNDFLFILRLNKEDMEPLGLSLLRFPPGIGASLSDGTEIYIDPKTFEYQIVRF